MTATLHMLGSFNFAVGLFLGYLFAVMIVHYVQTYVPDDDDE